MDIKFIPEAVKDYKSLDGSIRKFVKVRNIVRRNFA